MLFGIFSRLSSVKSPSTGAQEPTDKKRESRRSGFFNLIKSRTSRSEKSHGAASITPHPASPTAAASPSSPLPVPNDTPPVSPTPSAKQLAAAVEPHEELHKARPQDHVELEVEASTSVVEEKSVEKKDHPHLPRHIGVPVMGMDLLAEMKARQEKRAVKKVGGATGCVIYRKLLPSDPSLLDSDDRKETWF